MKNKPSNVIWVDFKTGRKIDLSNLGHPDKPAQPIPWLYHKDRLSKLINKGEDYGIFQRSCS